MFIENTKIRWTLILLIFGVGLYIFIPNIFTDTFKSAKKLNYGLDIQGGLYLVMGARLEDALNEKIERTARFIAQDLKEEGFTLKSSKAIKGTHPIISLEIDSPATKGRVIDFVKKEYPDLQLVDVQGSLLHWAYYEVVSRSYKKQLIEQSIEVVRNRIDAFGVAEPQISTQGDNRILIQLPGIENAEQAKEVINRTAVLSFRPVLEKPGVGELNKWVSEAQTRGRYVLASKEGLSVTADTKKTSLKYRDYLRRLNQDIASKLPKDSQIVFEKAPNATSLAAGKIPYLIRTNNRLTGEHLEDARVGYDSFGKPQVHFRFNLSGQKLFAEMTKANVGKRVAIVLDSVVQSAPVIQEEIDSPTAQITLGQSGDFNTVLEEAQLIATTLRAGSLPIVLEQLEERTVGASLGADSVEQGKFAGLIGLALVFIFMLLYYRFLGVLAVVALTFNILLIFAVLTSLGATLTLPGVAGIILTIGMSVDANVIIFERIREELEKGVGFRTSVSNGFGHAFSAIFDSNITTAAVCIILMLFGVGPVRGFAVTLLIGIMTSMFTAVFVSRTFFNLWASRRYNET